MNTTKLELNTMLRISTENAIYEKIQTLKDLTVEDLDVYQKFKNQFDQRLRFTSPYDPNEGPIITLTESVSSWNVGDQIVIGRISNFYELRRFFS